MSTYVYLECLDHDPVLSSDGEVGQHLYDLPRIRDEIAKRELFIANAASDFGIDYADHFTNNAARFLATHPRCAVGIRDEYGRAHSINPDDPCPHDSLSGGIDSGVWRCDECDAVGRSCVACRRVTFVGEPHYCNPS